MQSVKSLVGVVLINRILRVGRLQQQRQQQWWRR